MGTDERKVPRELCRVNLEVAERDRPELMFLDLRMPRAEEGEHG